MWQTVIGAGVALVGVLFAEWLARHRRRTLKVQANILDLAFSTPILTAYYSDHPDSPSPDSDYSGPYWTLRQSVFRQLGELRYLPRWPTKNAAKIRDEAEEIMLHLVAIEMRAQKGKLLSVHEQAAIHMKHDLHGLAFGLGVLDQDRLKQLEDEGFEDLVKEMWESKEVDED